RIRFGLSSRNLGSSILVRWYLQSESIRDTMHADRLRQPEAGAIVKAHASPFLRQPDCSTVPTRDKRTIFPPCPNRDSAVTRFGIIEKAVGFTSATSVLADANVL